MSSDLIKRIKELDWEHLSHGFGFFKDIPSMLVGLLSDDTDTSEIFDELSNTIIHQGTVFPVTCHALPFLIEIAKIYSYPDIGRLVGLILYITFNAQDEKRCMNTISDNVDVFFDLFNHIEVQEVIDKLEAQVNIVSILGYCKKKKDNIISFLKTQIKDTSNSILVAASILSLFEIDFPNQLQFIEDKLNSIEDYFTEFVILLKLLEYYKDNTPRDYLERLKKYLEDYDEEDEQLSEKIDFLIDRFYFYDALDNHALSYLSEDEFDFDDLIFKHNIKVKDMDLAKWGIKNNAPRAFFAFLENLLEDKEFAKWGVQNNASKGFYHGFNNLVKDKEFAKWGVEHDAEWDFYKYFTKFKEDKEFAKWGIENNAPFIFYKDFNKIRKNKEFAKWGVKNNAPPVFYEDMWKVRIDEELFRWGVKNNAPYIFYQYFNKLAKNPDFAKWGVKNNAPSKFYLNFNEIIAEPSSINSLNLPETLVQQFKEDFPSKKK